MGELQDEADKERRMRGKLSNEKRKLELDLQGQADSLDEERKCVPACCAACCAVLCS